MKSVLWYVLTSTRGGPNRIRILHALHEQPRNVHQLAEELDLNYKTVCHHLNILMNNNILMKSGDSYGAVYLPSEQARNHWDTIEIIIEQVDV